MVSGIFGKFISNLPKVVIISLVISLIEAMFILPSHAYDMMSFIDKRRSKKGEDSSDRVIKKNGLMQLI